VYAVTPKAYSPLSVAFEQPKSSVPPAWATPLSASKAMVAASIVFESQLFMFALPLLRILVGIFTFFVEHDRSKYGPFAKHFF
jgi:hypothetical protein